MFFFFSQVLNEYFHNVCELDLVFNFYKVSEELNIMTKWCVCVCVYTGLYVNFFLHRTVATEVESFVAQAEQL